jgi:protein-S-isoprenylcysteine O-methyltransferase Ste14
MPFNHIILAILWILYCFLHSLLATSRLKQKLKTRLKDRYKFYRISYTIFAFLFLVAILCYQLMLPTPVLFYRNDAVVLTGSLLCISGLFLMLVCIKKYFVSLSGLKSLVENNSSNQLIITGVHRFIRHPLYLGTFVFIWGLLLVFPLLSLLIANVIITLYTLVGIRLEEKKLIAEFGAAYTRYRQNVPMLIPSVKTKRAD